MKTTIVVPEPQKAALLSKAPPHIRLAAARRKKGILQTTISDALEITQGYFSQLENGIRKPTPELLKRWKALL